MPESKKIFSSFPPAGRAAWEKVAQAELDGADPWKKLTQTKDGLAILPYYDRNEGITLLKPSGNPFLGPRAWYNCPSIRVRNEAKSNLQALEQLKNGADGVLFDLSGETDFETLCRDISWKHASINFSVTSNVQSVAQTLIQYLRQNNIHQNCLPGSFSGNEAIRLGDSPFRMTGFTLPTDANVAESIARLFKELLKERDLTPFANEVSIRVSLTTDFFLSISTLRAIRTVWNKILEDRRVAGGSLSILAHSAVWNDQQFEPHGNMLKGTTAAIAAILGGCDVLSLDSEDSESAMTGRVARNISNILREESHLSKVADPVAGSYLIDQLTREIASSSLRILSSRV